MRKDIAFRTQGGLTLRGWHYMPDRLDAKAPVIVMAHGLSAVKEMYLVAQVRMSQAAPRKAGLADFPESAVTSRA